MDLKIFDVGHGACALLTCDNNTRLMIDCGHHAATGWKPGAYLRDNGITHLDMLAITNYDEDHVSGLPDLLQHVNVDWLWRNSSVSEEDIKKIKSKNGMGYGIERLVNLMSAYTYTGNQKPNFLNVERQAFFSPYPTFLDTNNLSMAIHLKVCGVNFLFAGDLESEGWNYLLKKQTFRDVISKTHVFVAPHHGRENGICPEVFDDHGCKPNYIVVSDKGHMHETQKTIDYYSGKALGGWFRGVHRRVLTTRKDGHITFDFSSNECRAM